MIFHLRIVLAASFSFAVQVIDLNDGVRLSTPSVDKSVEGHGVKTAQGASKAAFDRVGEFLVKLKYAFSFSDLSPICRGLEGVLVR